MADIRIRQVDPALHRGLKKSAVDAGLTLEEYCRRLLEGRGVEGHAGEGEGVEGSKVPGQSFVAVPGVATGIQMDRKQVSNPAAPSDTDDEPAPHDPEFCQQAGCRECKRLREENHGG